MLGQYTPILVIGRAFRISILPLFELCFGKTQFRTILLIENTYEHAWDIYMNQSCEIYSTVLKTSVLSKSFEDDQNLIRKKYI